MQKVEKLRMANGDEEEPSLSITIQSLVIDLKRHLRSLSLHLKTILDGTDTCHPDYNNIMLAYERVEELIASTPEPIASLRVST